MITSVFLDSIIKAIDDSIKNYSSLFTKETFDIDARTLNQSDLLNERTLSCFINGEIYKQLSKTFAIRLFANEYKVLFKNGINTSAFNSLIGEVGGKINAKRQKDGMWNYCTVDGIFLVKDIFATDVSTYIYFEYKLNNLFVLIDLATDFLKYKAITYKDETYTAFVYTIIDENVSYPTILSSSSPNYELINKDLSLHPISGDKRIYIYYPKSNTDSIDNKRKSADDLSSSIDAMVTARDLGNKILSFQKDKLVELDDFSKRILSELKKFNRKVAKSKILKNNSRYIHDLYVELNKHSKTDYILKLFGDDEIEKQNKIIEYACDYKNNLSDFLNGQKKRDSIENDGLNVSTNMSVLVLSIMDLAKEVLNINIASPILPKVKIRGRNQGTADWNKGLENNKTKLRNHYFFNERNEDGYNKLLKLAYSINFYLENLFGVMYERNSEYDVSGIKEEFIYEEAVYEMQSILNNLTKKIGLKDVKLDIKEIIDKGDTYNNNLLTLICNIINSFSNL